jgi:endonuclease/exonuclease/phosphatase family metal-dependent hydrolase
VVVLNEVDFRATWSKDVDQVEYLARRAGMPYYVYGPKWDFNSLLLHFRCGNAVLSKHPISGRNARFEQPSFWGWLAGDFTFMDLVLAIQGRRKINVLHSHLGGPPDRRNRQAQILTALGRQQLARGVPVIITGDLNADPPAVNAARRGPLPAPARRRPFRVLETILASRDFYLYKKLRQPGTPEARSMFTSAKSTIDHIIISRDLRYRRCFVPRVDLSDHRPMICDIELGTADVAVAQSEPGEGK